MQQDRLYIGIGLFVFGVILVILISTMFFFSQYIEGRRETYVMLFPGSLTGLESNSAVTYRGVRVGRVKRIELTANSSNSNVAIPVYVEFFIEKSFVYRGNPIQILINKGFVADITTPNLITGTASIEIVPAKRNQAPLRVKTFHGTPRFPTESTRSMNGEMNDTLKTVRTTLQDFSHFIKSKELHEMISAIKSMAYGVDDLSLTLDTQVPNLLLYFKDTLNQFSKAALSARNLTDYLFRHPESLLRGK